MEVIKVKNHRLAADNPDHFVILDDQGEEFKVAKHSLDPLTNEKIANLQKVEGYACGGTVKGYAKGGKAAVDTMEGGDLPTEIPQEPPPAADAPNPPQNPSTPGMNEYLNGTKAAADMASRGPQSDASATGEAAPNAPKAGGGILEALNNSLALTHPTDPSKPKVGDYVEKLNNALAITHPKGNQDAAIVPPKEPTHLEPGQPQGTPKGVVMNTAATPLPPQEMGPPSPTPMQQGLINYSTDIDKQTAALNKVYSDSAKVYMHSLHLANESEKHTRDAMDKLNSQANSILNGMFDPETGNLTSSNRVNPNQFWQDKGTFGRVAATLAAMVGGFSAAKTGGRNMALDILNSAIDRDIDAQKANLAQKNNLLAKNYELTQHMALAENMTRAQKMASMGAILENMKLQALGPEKQLAADQMKMQVMQMVEQLNIQNATALAQNRLTNPQSPYGAATPDDLRFASPEMQKLGVNIDGPGGKRTIGMAWNEGAQKNVLEAQKMKDEMQPLISEMRGIVNSGPAIPLTHKKAAAEYLASKLKFIMKDQEKAGRLNDDTKELLNEIVANPSSLLNSEQMVKIEHMQRDLDNSYQSALKNNLRNYTPPPVIQPIGGKKH